MSIARGIVAGLTTFFISLLLFLPIGAMVGLVNLHDFSGAGALMMVVPAALIGVFAGQEWATRPPDQKLSRPMQVLLWGILGVLLLSLVLSLPLGF